MKGLRVLVFLGLIAWLPWSARATGFMNFEHGAVGTAMMDAHTALADDLVSMFYNPAALAELDGFQLQLGTSGILPYTSYQAAGNPDPPRTYRRFNTGETITVSDGTQDADAKIRGYTPIHLHASYRIPGSGFTAGLSVFNPYGLGVFWPGDWDGRFLTTESELTTFLIQFIPVVDIAEMAGFKDNFKLSVSLGYALIPSTAAMARRIDLRVAEMLVDEPIVDPEGEMKLTGSAVGHGFIASLYAELPGLVSLGACWRRGFTSGGEMPLEFEGTGKFWFNSAGERAKQALALSLPDSTGGSVTLNLPESINVGIGLLAVEDLRVDLDFYYIFFESYDELAVKFDCTDCDLQNVAPQEADWNNSYQVSLGAEYRILGSIALRAGISYASTPVPDETVEPSLPHSPGIAFGLGAGYRSDWWKIDVGYMFSSHSRVKDNMVGWWDNDNNPNGLANGTYTNTLHILALSYTIML